MFQLDDIINKAIVESLVDTHTATIGRVVKVNEKTIDVQPIINTVYKGESKKLSVFTEVPPVFLQGGGSYTAHPIAVGDYALLLFTERCFDRWYSGADEVAPPEMRMHDYSDGFAIVGINPLSTAIAIPSVITHIGDAYQEGNYEHLGDRDQTGNYTLTGDQTVNGNVTINGDLTVNGNIQCTGTGTFGGGVLAANYSGIGGGNVVATTTIETTDDVIAGGVSLKNHTHTDSTGGTTSAPN